MNFPMGTPKKSGKNEMNIRAVSYTHLDVYKRQHISNLRKKLRVAPDLPDCVKSVYGIGYKFELK